MSENVDSDASTEVEKASKSEVEQKIVEKKTKTEENTVMMMQSGEEKESPTSTLLQLTDDCLLLLFTHLTLLQAFKLGSSSRRLYCLYQKAFLDRRSLFLKSERPFGNIFYENYLNGIASPFPPLNAADCFTLPRNYVPIAFSLLARLSNLVSLELKDVFYYKPAFRALINCLNTSLTKLQSLKLHFHGTYKEDREMIDKLSLQPLTDEQQQLKLPLLKHLVLFLNDSDEVRMKTILESSAFHSVLPQLTTFYCFASCAYLTDVLHFIYRHLRLNSQLMAAAESGGSEHLQIGLYVNSEYTDFCDKVIEGTLTKEEEGELAFVTQLVLDNSYAVEDPEVFFIQLLTLMPNVRLVGLFFCLESFEEFHDLPYPQLLTALTNLPHLEAIELNCAFYKPISEGEHVRFRQSEMPVLASVRSLTLEYRTSFHADPVEFLQLAHCFPGLKQISVSIEQYECEYCDYSQRDPVVMRSCALRVARGLLRLGKAGDDITAWESAVKVKKVVVGKFTSLANLVAGISSD